MNGFLRSALLLGCATAAIPAWAQNDPTPPDASAPTRGADPNAAENAGAAPENKEGIEDIIVTAERRASTAQRTAASIAVRTGDDLLRQGRTSLNQILEDVTGVSGLTSPGLIGGGTSAPEAGIAIRGVRSNGSGQGLASPTTTAVYVDGVYGGVSGNYDVDRVEVLRGPQGTLYGRSATGGVVSTYTRNPDLDDFSVSGLAELGSYDLRHFTGVVNVPIVTDRLALRVAGDHYERDGYFAPVGGAVNIDSLRAKLLFQANDDLTVQLGYSLQHSKVRSGGLTVRLTPTVGQFIFDTTTPLGGGSNKFTTYQGQIDWTLGPAHITYLGAIRDYEQDATGYQVGPGGGILLQRIVEPHNRNMSHELRVGFGDEGSFVGQIGGIYFNNRSRGFSNFIRWASSGGLLTSREQERDLDVYGGYGEGTLWLADSTRLTAGARYDETEIGTSFRYQSNVNRVCNTPSVPLPVPTPPGCVNSPNNERSGLPERIVAIDVTPSNGGSAKFNGFNYKVRLEHDLTPANMLYAMVSTGAIPGDVSVASSIPAQVYTYGSEKLTSFEIGSKNRFFDNKLQANISLYRYAYGGFQSVITPNPANSSESYFVTVPARMIGGELEIVGRPTNRDVITANASFIRPRYKGEEDITLQRPAPLASIPFTDVVVGNTIAGIIRRQANLSYEHRFDFVQGSSLNFRGSVRYQGRYQLASIGRALFNSGGLPYLIVPKAAFLNFSLDWNSADDRFGLTGYVRNLTKRRLQTGILLQSVSATAVNGSLQDQLFTEPRTFGVLARMRL